MQAIKALFPKNQIFLRPMSRSGAHQHDAVIGDTLGAQHDRRGLVTISAVVIASGALLLALLSSSVAEPLLLTLLALLAVFGAFFLLATAAGHIQITERLPAEQIATSVANQSADAMLLTSPDGQTLWINESMSRLLGTTSTGELGSLETALGATPQITEAMFRLSRAAEQTIEQTEEFPVALSSKGVGAPADITHIKITVSPIHLDDQDSNLQLTSDTSNPYALWRITDTSSERAREARTLAHREATLKQFDVIPVGVLTTATDGSIANINSTFCKQLGYDDSDEVMELGIKLGDMLSSDGVELLTSMAQRATDHTEEIDLDLVQKDGTIVPMRVMCQLTGDTADGLLITALNHRTEDQKDEQAPTSSVRFAKFFRSAPFGMATVGKDGRILNTNAAFSRMIVDGTRGIGRPAETVLSKTANEDASKAISKGLKTVLAGRGKVQPVDIPAGQDGEFTRRVYMHPLPRTKNAADAAILYLIDITEQKTLEAKFAQSQKMDAVGKLAGFVAHDFNNMLTAIIGFSDFLLQTHRPTDAAYSDIINIKSSANRAAGLVGKLLALARQQTLLVEPLQLSELMTDLGPLLKRSIGERIELKLSTGRDLWHVKTDKLQLEQAIINLAVNARDAMPDGGRLTLRTRNITERESQRIEKGELPRDEYVAIEVEDTGTGIDPKTLEKIFEPFFTTKAVGRGTGLGLATVHGIVQQSGGHIFPHSKVNKGTTFKIYLPRHHLEAKDEAAIAEKLAAKKSVQSVDLSGSGRVLLVEDEDVVRSFAVRALTRQGYEVLEAGDGAEALEVLANNDEIDIVVSDVVMPEMDGPTMLKEMRKTHPDLKIIFVSGYPNEAFQQSLGEETFAFLPKPFSLPQLAAKVKDELAD